MAKFAIKRLFTTQLIRDSPTMTSALIQRLKSLIVAVNLIRFSELPLVLLALDICSRVAVVFAVLFGCFAWWHCEGVLGRYTENIIVTKIGM
jgi:hypothetical protein